MKGHKRYQAFRNAFYWALSGMDKKPKTLVQFLDPIFSVALRGNAYTDFQWLAYLMDEAGIEVYRTKEGVVVEHWGIPLRRKPRQFVSWSGGDESVGVDEEGAIPSSQGLVTQGCSHSSDYAFMLSLMGRIQGTFRHSVFR